MTSDGKIKRWEESGQETEEREDIGGDRRREFNDFKKIKDTLNTLFHTVSLLHLQQDDHGEEHVEARQTGTVQVTVAVGDQVRGHTGQRLQP